MARATYTTKDGATVLMEGTEAEVASLLQRLEMGQEPKAVPAPQAPARKQGRATPMALLTELIDGGYFSQPRELGAVKATLQAQGHFYPATTLSPLMLRLVRRRELRRIKDNKHWLYVR
jgi:hypothetical protein